MVDWIGYVASIFIAVSITIKGGFYFRILNMIGSICFLFYGVFIESPPVILINIYCTGINIFHLVRKDKNKIPAKPTPE